MIAGDQLAGGPGLTVASRCQVQGACSDESRRQRTGFELFNQMRGNARCGNLFEFGARELAQGIRHPGGRSGGLRQATESQFKERQDLVASGNRRLASLIDQVRRDDAVRAGDDALEEG